MSTNPRSLGCYYGTFRETRTRLYSRYGRRSAALLLLLLGGELDHVVDAQHGDGRLRGELDHLDLGERRLDDARRKVVLDLACVGQG